MNVLERLVTEELTRVPTGPSAGDLRRRARVRRARRVGAVATVAVVFAVLAIAAMLQSPGSHQVRVVEPAPMTSTTGGPIAVTPLPLATTKEFPPLAKMIASLTGTVRSNTDPKAVVENPTSAEIVATTDTKAFALLGGTHDDKPVYVAQVTGHFLCEFCYGPAGSNALHGNALQVIFDSDGHGIGFGFGAQPKNLAQLGTVHRLELVPLATAEQFPALASMAEIVSNNVRTDYRAQPGSTRPTSGEIVETTRGRAFSLFGGSTDNLDARIFVIEVFGNFTCDECSRPSNAVAAPQGNSLHLLFDATGRGYGFGIGEPIDLSTLGTVYRVELPG
jgi:hypothetical protein